jgi:hypothetical protein
LAQNKLADSYVHSDSTRLSVAPLLAPMWFPERPVGDLRLAKEEGK